MGHSAGLIDGRQHDAKSRAAIEPRLVLKRATVHLDDARSDGEAEAGAGFFGSEKGVEKALLDFGRNAFAGVADFENDNAAVVIGEALGVLTRAQGNGAITANAFGGVLHQIDEHLLDLLRIHMDAGRKGILESEMDVRFFEFRSEQRVDFAQRLFGWHGDETRLGRAAKKQDVFDDAFEAVDLAGDDLGVVELSGSRLQLFLLDEKPG